MAKITVKKSVLLEFMKKSGVDCKKCVEKSANDTRFEDFKKQILEHLDSLEKDEGELKKSLIAYETEYIEKGGKGLPVGTIREWKGKKYIKIAPNKWRPKYDSNTRGAKMAIAAIKRKAAQCTDSKQLLQLILENRERFSDENGRPLPFVKELSDYVSGLNDNLESTKTAQNETPEEDFSKYDDKKLKREMDKLLKKKGVTNSEKERFKKLQSEYTKRDNEKREKEIIPYAENQAASTKTEFLQDDINTFEKQLSDTNDEKEKKRLEQTISVYKKELEKRKATAEEEKRQAGIDIMKQAIKGLENFDVDSVKDSDIGDKIHYHQFNAKQAEKELESMKKNNRDKESIELKQKEIDLENGIVEKLEKRKETEEEKHRNRSEAMKGNKNAYKGGPDEETKSLEMKSVEELQDFAKTNFGIDVTVKSKKDLEEVKKSFAQIERMCNIVPGLNKYIEKVVYEKLGKNVGGDYEFLSRTLRIGSMGDESLNENFTFAQGNSDIAAATAHEIGHAIQNMLADTGEDLSRKELEKIYKPQCKDIVNQALKNIGLDTKRKNQSVRNMQYSIEYKDGKRVLNKEKFSPTEQAILDVSVYAFSDDAETISECIADVFTNGDNAQPISKEIYKITMQRLKDKPPVEQKEKSAEVVENKISEIVDKATQNNNSRLLLSNMVTNLISGGGRSVNEFLDKHKIKTQADVEKYIDGVIQSKNVSIRETQSDDDFLRTIGIGQVGEVDTSKAPKKADISTIRDKYKNSQSVDGDDDTITLPDGTELEGKWKLVEADAPSASHDEMTFQKTEGFPANDDGSTINDRDYEHDSAAKEAVIDMSADFDSRALHIDSPVVVSEDGVVISGNNRTMSSKLAARKGTDTKYIEALNKKAKKFGFTSDDVSKFKNPRVVFETNVNGKYSTNQFAKFNQSSKKAQSPVETAVKIAKTVNTKTVESIADRINQYDTLGELYADNKSMRDVFNTLIESDLIKKTDLPAYYTDESGVTNNGKEFLETVLVGSVINENNIRNLASAGGKEIRQKLVRAIVPLVENKGMKGYSIAKELNEAVSIAVEIKKNKKFKDADDYSKQGVLIGEQPDKIAIEFAKKLEGTQKEFAEFMRSLNGGLRPAANGETDIFLGGVESRDEILSRYMTIKKSIRELFNSFFK